MSEETDKQAGKTLQNPFFSWPGVFHGSRREALGGIFWVFFLGSRREAPGEFFGCSFLRYVFSFIREYTFQDFRQAQPVFLSQS